MTDQTMTTTEVVENTLTNLGVDDLLGCSAAEITVMVLAMPTLLLDLAEQLGGWADRDLAAALAFHIIDTR